MDNRKGSGRTFPDRDQAKEFLKALQNYLGETISHDKVVEFVRQRDAGNANGKKLEYEGEFVYQLVLPRVVEFLKQRICEHVDRRKNTVGLCAPNGAVRS